MLTAYVGELAALVTAIAWALSSQFNGYVGSKVGASGITLLRLPFQAIFLATFCLIGGAVVSFESGALLFLALSALSGVAVGDLALYRAINLIGTRAAILLQSLCTSFTAIFGFVFLGEMLTWTMAAGIFITTAGVVTVVTERPGNVSGPGLAEPSAGEKRLGILLGVFSSAVFAVSMIFLRAAMKSGLDPRWGGFLRVFIAGSSLWALGFALGWSQAAVSRIRTVSGVKRLLVFSCLLGATGMWSSCIALRNLQAGVAATIMSLQPIWVILTYAMWTRKLPSKRMILGSLAAFGGTALVCLR